jgi:transcriptional regulator with XRE-family HTH domain
MRSKIAKGILDKTPKDVEVFVRLYSDIVVRIHEVIQEKGITQKELAARMGKSPSEISKWLAGDHNFTLRSLAKLQAVLDETIISVPKRKTLQQLPGEAFEG